MALKSIADFPSTRYQGSKRKIAAWLWSGLEHLDFSTCLDFFSGTAAVSYLFKTKGKSVTSNDYLRFNHRVADALVVNDTVQIEKVDLEAAIGTDRGPYDDFIGRNFGRVFYTDAENQWLDRIVQNISALPNGHKKSLLFQALFQACLAKRPYNLFHRANLYMRTAEVQRSFGNKATWDTDFTVLFYRAAEAANAAVFCNGRRHQALTQDFRAVPGGYDLVYVDPPDLNHKGAGVDYLDFYHFLEGISDYDRWSEKICLDYKHRPHQRRPSPWHDKKEVWGAFDDVLDNHKTSIVAISYRSNGTPTAEEIGAILRKHSRRHVRVRAKKYNYVLSKSGRGQELIFVSEPARVCSRIGKKP